MKHNFLINRRRIEVFLGKDKHIEVYEEDNPGKTGFEFDNIKQLNVFINELTDIAELFQEE